MKSVTKLGLVMVALMIVLAACGGNNNTSNTGENGTGNNQGGTDASPVTLTMMMSGNKASRG